MPDKALHIARAERNERFYGTIGSQYPDWALAALFYSALHYVDAVLDHTERRHPNNHGERETLLSRNPSLAPVAIKYFELRNRCDDARYRLIEVPATKVQDLRDDHFATVKDAARRALGLP